jgi:hypothetical protein
MVFMDWKQTIAALVAGSILGISGAFFAFQERVSKLEIRLEAVEKGGASAGAATTDGPVPSSIASSLWSVPKADASPRLDQPIPVQPVAVVYGPTDGTVPAKTAGFVAEVPTSVALSDFAIQVRFFNPPSTTRGNWSYGVEFRSSPTGEYRFSVHSDGYWVLTLMTKVEGKAEFRELARGLARSLNLSRPGHNDLVLAVKGSSGYVRVNGRSFFVLTLPDERSGEIKIASGFASGDVLGEATRYEGFKIFSVE